MATPVAVSVAEPVDAESAFDAPATALQQDVVRFHVAVDDAERVGGPERVRRLQHDATRLVRGQLAAPLELRAQRLPVHIRHHEVHQPVGPLAHGVDRHDVRVRQAGRRLRLAQKP